eukprot:SAG11_NODE_5576_length_1519_cov_1.973944_1_plen_102_part_00
MAAAHGTYRQASVDKISSGCYLFEPDCPERLTCCKVSLSTGGDPGGGSGLHARVDIAPGEIVYEVPSKFFLTITVARQSPVSSLHSPAPPYADRHVTRLSY